MTEEEKATAPTAEKGPKDCKTCHSAGHIGPVCADCIELAYRHYTPEAPEGDGAEEGEELAALLITLDDAVGDLEADGNPEYAEAINQARHILTVLTQPREPRAEASGEADKLESALRQATYYANQGIDYGDTKHVRILAKAYLALLSSQSAEKTVLMERAHELKYEIREALRDLGLESVYAKGVADKTLDALEELEALAVTGSAKEEGR